MKLVVLFFIFLYGLTSGQIVFFAAGSELNCVAEKDSIPLFERRNFENYPRGEFHLYRNYIGCKMRFQYITSPLISDFKLYTDKVTKIGRQKVKIYKLVVIGTNHDIAGKAYPRISTDQMQITGKRFIIKDVMAGADGEEGICRYRRRFYDTICQFISRS